LVIRCSGKPAHGKEYRYEKSSLNTCLLLLLKPSNLVGLRAGYMPRKKRKQGAENPTCFRCSGKVSRNVGGGKTYPKERLGNHVSR
jgi:hypothetical protein